jgi:purine-binding chemotaxis protein CheW
MPAMDYTERTCIIVVEIRKDAASILIGIVVDAVSEVLNIKAGDIEETPDFGNRLQTDFVLGMAKAAEGIKILLDIERVLQAGKLENMNMAA